MGLGDDDHCVHHYTCGIEVNRGFSLLIVFMILWVIVTLLCTAVIDADDNGARSFTVEGIKYKVISGYAVEVVGSENLEELDIPLSVEYFDVDYTVVSIGKKAFRGCVSLTTVIIPECVRTIGYAAFSDCRSLAKVTLGNSVTSVGKQAFINCESLTTVTFPFGVSSIGKDAFAGCTSMKHIIIPSSVISIGKGAFSSCKFYDTDGQTEITDYSELPGHTYIGESSSKLIRESVCTAIDSSENSGSYFTNPSIISALVELIVIVIATPLMIRKGQ